MDKRASWRARLGVLMNEGNGPWGGGNRGSGGDGAGGNGGGNGGGPRNPWSQPPGGGDPNRGGGGGPRGPSVIDELLRKGRESFGGGMPPRTDGKSWWPYLALAIVGIWLISTSVHRVGPQERAVVTLLGSYSRTLPPGIGLTLPAPIESVTVIDVENIRVIDIGSTSGGSEKLVLTGDQNLIDLAYSIRWNISDPGRFIFQIAEPEATIAEVGESAMRAVLATVQLDSALGAGRTGIEQQVALRMQEILDGYGAGVRVQGIAIKQADPPDLVNDAFKEVSAAQQTANTYLNEARAYAQQITARAQGEAAAFDKVYEQYRLAPEVTRQRMYYETMERVLSGVDKTIVESRGVTPYLPLPEAGRRAPRPDAAQAAANAGGQP